MEEDHAGSPFKKKHTSIQKQLRWKHTRVITNKV